MEKRKIGQLTVSEIGMGVMGFSHGYGKVPEESYALAAIRKAFEAGCTFFDTAEGYGKEQFFAGHNEQLLGKATATFRNQVVLATKLHVDEKELVAEPSLEKVIRQHLAQSLENLQTDFVDLYYLHRVNELIPVESVVEVMGKLRAEGLIKEWGLSQVSVETLAKAHQVTPVAAVQNLYSMLERDVEQDIFPFCLAHDIAVVPFSPIASGFLSGKVTTQTAFGEDDVRKFVPQLTKENIAANQPVLTVLSTVAAEKNATLAQISLAWMLKKYPNVIPIPGSKNQERILENLGAAAVHLTDSEFAELENSLEKIAVHGHRGHVEFQHKSFLDVDSQEQ